MNAGLGPSSASRNARRRSPWNAITSGAALARAGQRTGCGGPYPPLGRHRYFHKLYALSEKLGDLGEPTKAELERAMQGKVLAQAELVGIYEKSRDLLPDVRKTQLTRPCPRSSCHVGLRWGRHPHAGEIEDAGFEFAEEVAIEGLTENYVLRFRRP